MLDWGSLDGRDGADIYAYGQGFRGRHLGLWLKNHEADNVPVLQYSPVFPTLMRDIARWVEP
jgi:hypothetical protein